MFRWYVPVRSGCNLAFCLKCKKEFDQALADNWARQAGNQAFWCQCPIEPKSGRTKTWQVLLAEVRSKSYHDDDDDEDYDTDDDTDDDMDDDHDDVDVVVVDDDDENDRTNSQSK